MNFRNKFLAATMAAALVAAAAPAPLFAGNGNGNGKGNSAAQNNGGGNRGQQQSQGSHGNAGAAQNRGGNGNGAIASELKNLNAAHANENALHNADPESNVGLIAAYRDAATLTAEAGLALEQAQGAYDGYGIEGDYAGRTSAEIQADIDALNIAMADAPARLAEIGLLIEALDIEIAGLTAQLSDPDPEIAAAAALTLEAKNAELGALLLEQSTLSALMASAPQMLTDLELELQIALAYEALVAAQGGYDGALLVESDALFAAAGGRTLSDDALAAFRGMLGL